MEPDAPELAESWCEPVFTPGHVATLGASLALAEGVIQDPRFRSVLSTLSAAGKIDWSRRRGKHVPPSHRSRPTDWFMERYSAEGLYSVDQISARCGRSATKAWTTATVRTTALNVRGMNRSEASIAGTLVHEMAHSYGHVHWTQKARNNRCDFAYVAGSTASLLLMSDAAGGPVTWRYPLCDALRAELVGRSVLLR